MQQRHSISTLCWAVRGLEMALETRGAATVLRWSAALARQLTAIQRSDQETWPADAADLHVRVQRAWQRLFDLHHPFAEWDSIDAEHACMALDHAEAALRRIARAGQRRRVA